MRHGPPAPRRSDTVHWSLRPLTVVSDHIRASTKVLELNTSSMADSVVKDLRQKSPESLQRHFWFSHCCNWSFGDSN
jgi:hypothetical protein